MVYDTVAGEWHVFSAVEVSGGTAWGWVSIGLV